MTTIRIDRYTVDPANAESLLALRRTLVAAVREKVTGLVTARLAKAEDGTWVDLWQWESREQAMQAVALAGSGELPQAGAAFALATEHTTEFLDLVDDQ
jgi:hypothetical protein